MRAMTYLAVNHGAKGLIYYSYFNIRDDADYGTRWPQIKEIAREIDELRPVLLSIDQTNDNDIVCNDNNIDFKFMRQDSTYYLFAVNATNESVTGVSFQINIAHQPEELDILFEPDRTTIPVIDESITDDFAPYEVHIYWGDFASKDVANSDIPVQGKLSGNYTDTHSSDDIYEAITERQSGGKPSNRYSFLEHKWTINATGGSVAIFHVEAYKTSSSDGDNFVFAYSIDDSNYTEMMTITKTSDDDIAQSYQLPASTKGTVYIRVKDTDLSQGNNSPDTIYIDNMYIRFEDIGVPDNDPPVPNPMTWAAMPYATGPTSIAMEATAASDDTDVEYYFECIGGGGHNSGWQGGTYYEDTALQSNLTYTYRVRARDKSPNQNVTDWSTAEGATTPPPCQAITMHVESIACGTARGSKGRQYGTVTVTVYDDCGNPLSGADVTGTFTGDFNEQHTENTNGNGVAVISTTAQVRKPAYTFCADNVGHADLTYDSNDNPETCRSN
jgi:hypothetical protein